MLIKNHLTIIIVNHNYGMYLKKCLSSVLKNDLTRVIEIIIIDDSSTDKSLKLIEKLKKSNKKIRSLKVKYKNLSKTLNYAIRTVKTEWLLKIDADDYISQNMIKEFVRHWINCDFILGNVCLFNKNKINKKKQVIKTNFLKFFFHPIGSGNLYKKKLWQTIGGYNESNKFKDDVYFWIKILKIENLKIKHLNNYMYFYRQHKKSMSKNTLKKNLVLLKIIFNDLLS